MGKLQVGNLNKMRIKIFILVSTCLFFYGCKDKGIEYDQAMEAIKSAFEQPAPQSESESMEYMLACIDAGYYVPRDDASVEKFRTLLHQLDEKFIENERQIGDTSVSTKFLLRDNGIQESLLNIMEGMNQLFSSKPENIKYAEYTSIYLGMRKKEYSHDNAIKGLKTFLQNQGIY